MTITQANTKDLEEILSLQKKCYLQEAAIYNDYSIPPLTQTFESIEKEFLSHTFLIAKEENKIIGSIRGAMSENTCRVGKLIVDKDFQNRGVGKTLLFEMEQLFKDAAERFELFTGNKSLKNLYLYNKLGYNEYKREKVNDRLELVFLEKKTNNSIQI